MPWYPAESANASKRSGAINIRFAAVAVQLLHADLPRDRIDEQLRRSSRLFSTDSVVSPLRAVLLFVV